MIIPVSALRLRDEAVPEALTDRASRGAVERRRFGGAAQDLAVIRGDEERHFGWGR